MSVGMGYHRDDIRTALRHQGTWERHALVTERIAGQSPTAHYIADEDTGHGFQLTDAPRTACGRVVPNTMLVETLYRDQRCPDCLLAVPDAEPYPAPALVIEYHCYVCDDNGDVRWEDGPAYCSQCDTQWPNGPGEPGVRRYPDHVDPHTGLPHDPDGESAVTVVDVQLPPTGDGRDLVEGEQPHTVGAYLLADGMRVLCQHDHPAAWVKILERLPNTMLDSVDIDSLAWVRLACGFTARYGLGDAVPVVLDEPLAEDVESVDA
jgi:hypothetical protein